MKTQYAHEAERPFLAWWRDCEPEVDWHRMRVLVELEPGHEITTDAMMWLVNAYGAGNLHVEAFANAGCDARLRVIAYLEREGPDD